MATILAFDDRFFDQHLDNGIAYLKINRFVEAVDEFNAALRINPDDRFAHWNKAMALLSLGDYRNGFREHEWGFKLFHWRDSGPVRDDIDRIQHLPVWNGEENKRLLIYHELGFGDGIMAMRYLPELKKRAQVTLIVAPELSRLAESFGVEVVERMPDDVSVYDYRLPFFGVMYALKQTVHNIPSKPYIGANWRLEGGKVGIVWSGRSHQTFSLDYFLSMLDISGFDVYALQPFSDDRVWPLQSKDFADTVDLISQMDHVITIDTAIAHLAGAMGHPSQHLLLPFQGDWRWWHADAWYPKIKTYRQSDPSDWTIPFSRVNEALRA